MGDSCQKGAGGKSTCCSRVFSAVGGRNGSAGDMDLQKFDVQNCVWAKIDRMLLIETLSSTWA